MADMVDRKRHEAALDALELVVRQHAVSLHGTFGASRCPTVGAAMRVLLDAGRMSGWLESAKFVEYEPVMSPDDIEMAVYLCYDKQMTVTEFREALRGLKRVKS